MYERMCAGVLRAQREVEVEENRDAREFFNAAEDDDDDNDDDGILLNMGKCNPRR